jgi:hypothetical protein
MGFLFRFFQEDGKIRAVKVAEAAFDAVLDTGRVRQTVPFFIHLLGEVIDFLGAIGDAKPAALAKVFDDGCGHSYRSSFHSGEAAGEK